MKKRERPAGLGWCGGREKEGEEDGPGGREEGSWAREKAKGERGPEEGFCLKKRKEEGFVKPYEKETK